MATPAVGWLRLRDRGLELRVRVMPGTSRVGFDGLYGDRLKVRITAPPVGGAANEALIRFIARALRVAPSRGRVVAGARDRSKTLLFECEDPAAAAERLRAVLAAVDKRSTRT
jgi:hypothetical protein